MENQPDPNPNPKSQPVDPPSPSSFQPDPAGSETPGSGGEGEVEEAEEEAECGFCLFMKGGGCKDAFVTWEKCIKEAEKSEEDIADKCFDITQKLKLCVDEHADYYAPILDAEKSMAKAVSEAEEADKSEAGDGGAPLVESEKSAAP
ncbi:uncharacterized protein M6B38_263435 [Iris pallida]|uniref:GCK domain-containing protein n=1 Tax=Iris pallida TaxID=29817 RepID=A0AAX6IBC3_IRIPA|nr:uncharacterized protein M6B38_263435 [Iris pallida]